MTTTRVTLLTALLTALAAAALAMLPPDEAQGAPATPQLRQPGPACMAGCFEAEKRSAREQPLPAQF